MKSKKFYNICKQIRKKIITSLYYAQSGHSGPSLSIVETLAYLYFCRKIISKTKNEKLVLSKGHAVPALYATLNLVGKITSKDLNSLRKINSPLQGHPDRKLLNS